MTMICPQAGYVLIDFSPNKGKKTQKNLIKLIKREEVTTSIEPKWGRGHCKGNEFRFCNVPCSSEGSSLLFQV